MARETVGGADADKVDETSSTNESIHPDSPPEGSADPPGGSAEGPPARPRKRAAAKKTAAKKTPAKNAPARSAGAAKAAATEGTPNNAAASEGTARKAPARKAAAKRSPAKKAATATLSTRPGPDEETTTAVIATDPDATDPAPDDPASNDQASNDQASATDQPDRAKKRTGKKPGPQSATAKRAAAARATMQRQHRRIEFWRAVALGMEAAGAAGLVVAGLLAWEWTDRLWGRTDQAGITGQVAIAVAVLALVAAWLLRNDGWRIFSRTVAMIAVVVVAAFGAGTVWNAELGARGIGGLVAAVAAVLVVAGSVVWLVALRRIRKLFAFGVGYARTGGYGNLPAVRRAQLLGAPAGAIGVAVVVTGTFLVAPGLISTEDVRIADSPLVLSGDPPAPGDGPSWEIELAAGVPNTTVRATPGGLAVDELHGIRMVDPANGETRWHWRDEAYRRVAVAVAEQGAMIVLGLQYDGELAGRDRLVALDTATGEVRWDEFNDEVVLAMANLGVAPVDGSWLAVPDGLRESPDAEVDPSAQPTPVGVRLVDLATGEVSWRDAGSEGCTMAAIGAGSPDVVTIVENCLVPPEVGNGADECRVSGVAVEDGRRLWDWPSEERIDPAEDYSSGCRLTSLENLVFLTYQETAIESDPGAPVVQTPALALDPLTGEEVWAAERDEDSYTPLGVDGLTNPAAVVGDRVVGVEWPSGQPGLGAAALIIRDVTDGSRVGEVSLPEGQPVGVRAAGDDFVAISHYLPEADQILLVEVDLVAGVISAEAPVASGSPTVLFRSAGLAVGPGAMAVDTLILPSEEAGMEELRLVVHGFS